MAVLMTQTMPEGVTVQMLDAVTEAMGVENDPPAGMVVHVHYQRGGRTEVADVWESRERFDRFAQERLPAAMREAVGDRAEPPEVTQTELHAFYSR